MRSEAWIYLLSKYFSRPVISRNKKFNYKGSVNMPFRMLPNSSAPTSVSVQPLIAFMLSNQARSLGNLSNFNPTCYRRKKLIYQKFAIRYRKLTNNTPMLHKIDKSAKVTSSPQKYFELLKMFSNCCSMTSSFSRTSAGSAVTFPWSTRLFK